MNHSNSLHSKWCGLGLLIFFTLYIPLFTQAQTLKLYDAVNKAIANYPLIKQRQSEVAASKAHITTVNGYVLPDLILGDEATTGTANSLEGAYFSLGMIPSVSGSINPIEKNNLGSGNIAISMLQWEFYNFGYYNAQKKQAQAELAATTARLNGDNYLLTEKIISLYLDWVKKYRLVQIENENLQRSGTILNAIRATVTSGLKPGVDSATASAAYADARISYLQALDNYDYDKISLSTYTGSDTSIQPDTAIITQAFQNKLYQFQPSDSITIDHPLLDIFQKQYQLQLANNKAISKAYLPKFNLLGAAWQRSSSITSSDNYAPNVTDAFQNNRYNYLFGLSLTYNIFDLKHQRDELREGRYTANAQQSALQTEQLTLNKMLQQANSSYSITTEKLNELPVQLHSAEQAYGQQIALYKAGLNTLIDVTNALYVLRQTQTNLVVAQDELLQLIYIRAGLSNQLDIFLQNFK
ncbi:MAG TPA: TolC family protein [Flavipsychrobacter sp.]|nr:TolC family protein [Flavipsychrobacter sp.]